LQKMMSFFTISRRTAGLNQMNNLSHKKLDKRPAPLMNENALTELSENEFELSQFERF
jgi:hypothetical protein